MNNSIANQKLSAFAAANQDRMGYVNYAQTVGDWTYNLYITPGIMGQIVLIATDSDSYDEYRIDTSKAKLQLQGYGASKGAALSWLNEQIAA